MPESLIEEAIASTTPFAHAAAMGDIASMQRHLDKLKQMGERPNAVLLGYMMLACRRARHFDRLAPLALQMASAPIPRMELIATQLVAGFCASEQPDQALLILREFESALVLEPASIGMNDGNNNTTTTMNGSVASPATTTTTATSSLPSGLADRLMNLIRNAYAHKIESELAADQFNAAMATFQQVKSSAVMPNTSMFNAFMMALVKRNRFVDTEMAFAEMIRLGCVPDSASYAALIEVYLAQNDIDAIVLLFENKLEFLSGLPTSILSRVLKAASRKSAMSLVDRVFTCHPLRAGELFVLMQGQLRTTHLEHLFTLMLHLLEQQPPVTVQYVLNTLCRAGLIDKATVLLEWYQRKRLPDPEATNACALTIVKYSANPTPRQPGRIVLEPLPSAADSSTPASPSIDDPARQQEQEQAQSQPQQAHSVYKRDAQAGSRHQRPNVTVPPPPPAAQQPPQSAARSVLSTLLSGLKSLGRRQSAPSSAATTTPIPTTTPAAPPAPTAPPSPLPSTTTEAAADDVTTSIHTPKTWPLPLPLNRKPLTLSEALDAHRILLQTGSSLLVRFVDSVLAQLDATPNEQLARSLLEQLREFAVPDDKMMRACVRIYHHLLRQAIRQSDIAGAHQLIDDMHHSSIPIDDATYLHVVQCHLQAGDAYGAERALARLSQPPLDFQCAIARLYAQQDRSDRVMHMIEHTMRTTSTQPKAVVMLHEVLGDFGYQVADILSVPSAKALNDTYYPPSDDEQ